jgi:hypothetical protein
MSLAKNLRETYHEVTNQLDEPAEAIAKKRQLGEDEDHQSQIESTADSMDRKRFKRSNTLDSHPTPDTKPEMDPNGDGTKDGSVDDLAGDMGKMKLDGESSQQEDTRQRLRDWAAQWSTGEIGHDANNPQSGQDNVNKPEPQASSSQGQGEGLQPQNASQPLAGDPEKKPARRSRHTRSGAQDHIAFSAPQVARPVLHGNSVPPVPPIPFRYRAEWAAQQRLRQEMIAEPFTPRAQSSREQSQFALRREPQENEDEDDDARSEAARRQNERRRRAFDAVVEEDLGDRSTGKGRSRPSDVARAQAPAGPTQLVRPETRLPRSPGMLHLSREMPGDIPESPVITPPRSRFQVPVPRNNMRARDEDVFGEPSFANRARGGMTRNYGQELISPSEAAEMETKAAEREKEKFKKD